jgi:hypothetical protein
LLLHALLWLLISWRLPARRTLAASRAHDHHGCAATYQLVRKPELAGLTWCHHALDLSKTRNFSVMANSP